ncbi:hypothetical protein ACVFVO_03490 [Advenella kashmirensis]
MTAVLAALIRKETLIVSSAGSDSAGLYMGVRDGQHQQERRVLSLLVSGAAGYRSEKPGAWV